MGRLGSLPVAAYFESFRLDFMLHEHGELGTVCLCSLQAFAPCKKDSLISWP
jgi:hypothetical protein